MLTALVVDDSAGSRRRIAVLLKLGGWRVHTAIGTDAALRLAAVVDPDLVVTEMTMRNGHGATLMRRLRTNGSHARFLVVSARRTQQVRALAASAGALACLAKPVDPRLFVEVLAGLAPPPGHTTDGPAEPARAASPLPAGRVLDPQALEAGVVDRTEEMFLSALPHRLSTIAGHAQEGNASAVATSAEALATASDRTGHARIAFACHAIAADARRGVLAHTRLMHLLELCAHAEGAAAAGQPLPSA